MQAVAPLASIPEVLALPPYHPGLQSRQGPRGVGRHWSGCRDEQLLGAGLPQLAHSVLHDRPLMLPWKLRRALRISPPWLQMLKDSPRRLGWLRGLLPSPSPSPSVTDLYLLRAHFPSYNPSKSPKAWGMDLSPGTSVVQAWPGTGQKLPQLVRGRGLAGPSYVWHLHT